MIRNTQCRKYHNQFPYFVSTLRCCQTGHKSALTESQQDQIIIICKWQTLHIFLNRKQICNLCPDRHIRGFSFTLYTVVRIKSASATKAEAKCHIAHLGKIPAKVIHVCIDSCESMTYNNCRIAFLFLEIRREILCPTNQKSISFTCKQLSCNTHIHFPLSFTLVLLILIFLKLW